MNKFFLFFIFSLASFGLAQQECASLLEAQSTAMFDSIEQSITTTTNLGESTTINIYQVLDMRGKRLYQETSIPGMGNVVFRFVDGSASMQIEGVDMSMPVPDMLLGQLEGAFDQVFEQVNVVPSGYTIVSCDGMQSHAGGLLSGEQVTISTTLPGLGNQEVKLLFMGSEPVGTISTIPQMGTVLSVIEQQNVDANGIPAVTTVSVYQLEGANASLISTSTVTTVSYNQPVNDDLF